MAGFWDGFILLLGQTLQSHSSLIRDARNGNIGQGVEEKTAELLGVTRLEGNVSSQVGVFDSEHRALSGIALEGSGWAPAALQGSEGMAGTKGSRQSEELQAASGHEPREQLGSVPAAGHCLCSSARC